MFLPPDFFRGLHRLDGWHEAQKGNRAIIARRCAPITVTAEDLMKAIDEQGVNSCKAKDLVEMLIERANAEGLARTLGL